MSQEEIDHGNFHTIYWWTLKALAEEPKAACDAKGNYNTPWEIQDELVNYAYLATSAALAFDATQRNGMLKLAEELKSLPREAIAPEGVNMQSAAGCLQAMQHPAWQPPRMRARHLLEALAPAFERSEAYWEALGAIPAPTSGRK
jgi:hypothetical protein